MYRFRKPDEMLSLVWTQPPGIDSPQAASIFRENHEKRQAALPRQSKKAVFAAFRPARYSQTRVPNPFFRAWSTA